jgi:hypothetical protein
VQALRAWTALLLLLVAAVPPTAAAEGQEEPPDTVVEAALNAASTQLGVPADNLIVVMTAQRDWADASLGCPEPGRTYAQVITPGYAVWVDTDDLVMEVQVNTDTGSRTAIC